EIRPPPGPEVFGLPPEGSAQLNTHLQTVWDGAASVPQLRAVDAVVVSLLLDVAHWPRGSVELGHTWSRPIGTEDFQGAQNFTLRESSRLDDERVAVIEVNVEGAFRGPNTAGYRFDGATAKFIWARGDRVIVRLDGNVRYHRAADAADEPHIATLSMVLAKRVRLTEAGQSLVRRSLADVAMALADYEAGRYSQTVAACTLFADRWKRSPWLPMARWIEERAVAKSRGGRRMNAVQLTRALAELVVRWDAAVSEDDIDLEGRVRRGFTQILSAQKSDVRAMLRSKDENVRALAVFAWAFGESPNHYLAVADAVEDASPRVRAWAANGLAARGGPNIDLDILLRLLNDEALEVRARGCMAVSRCLPQDEPLAGRARDRLLVLLSDDHEAVRLEAISAFARLGSPIDVAALEAARTAEVNASCAAALDRALERIKTRSD
ncbi:MAG: HEAT repeat domain-containing protein, partial [Phycisphaerae bacterium]